MLVISDQFFFQSDSFIDENEFTGGVPTEIGKLTELRSLEIRKSSLCYHYIRHIILLLGL